MGDEERSNSSWSFLVELWWWSKDRDTFAKLLGFHKMVQKAQMCTLESHGPSNTAKMRAGTRIKESDFFAVQCKEVLRRAVQGRCPVKECLAKKGVWGKGGPRHRNNGKPSKTTPKHKRGNHGNSTHTTSSTPFLSPLTHTTSPLCSSFSGTIQ